MLQLQFIITAVAVPVNMQMLSKAFSRQWRCRKCGFQRLRLDSLST